MISTLAERLAEAMAGPPVVTGAALARICGVSAPSVSDWLSGKSKTMEASNLLAAARLLNVDPDWLATGIGRKQRAQTVSEAPAIYQLSTPTWPFRGIGHNDLKKLSEFDLGQVEGFIKGLLQADHQLRKSNGDS